MLHLMDTKIKPQATDPSATRQVGTSSLQPSAQTQAATTVPGTDARQVGESTWIATGMREAVAGMEMGEYVNATGVRIESNLTAVDHIHTNDSVLEDDMVVTTDTTAAGDHVYFLDLFTCVPSFINTLLTKYYLPYP